MEVWSERPATHGHVYREPSRAALRHATARTVSTAHHRPENQGQEAGEPPRPSPCEMFRTHIGGLRYGSNSQGPARCLWYGTRVRVRAALNQTARPLSELPRAPGSSLLSSQRSPASAPWAFGLRRT
eukprot:scaffold171194_cov33-Tisochrysis_lutea.AAC.1